MTALRPPPPLRVPTLTEVVEFDPLPNAPAAPESVPAKPDSSDAGDLNARILALVQRQLDASCESRLREAIAPALARCADALIRDLQSELASTLQGLVARAVEQERLRTGEQATLAPRRDGGTTPD
ncbi:MAG: hypothetical protein ABIO45_02210 [Burkholderiaceae bacterium]